MSAYQVKYPWRAYFRGGTSLSQFEPDGSENMFRKVLDRAMDLDAFQVGPVTLFLRDGSFTVEGLRITGSSSVKGFEEWGIDERLSKRLIYFRRVTRRFGMGGDVPKEEAAPYVVYALGWQATVEGRNVKHILFLHPGGELVFA